MMQQIVFLTHLNRSGSTYLARLLNEYVEIGVTIEAKIPDGIHYRYRPSILRDVLRMRRAVRIESEAELEDYLDELFADSKFIHWGIGRDTLKNGLLSKGIPLHFGDVLGKMLGLYFDNPAVKVYIFKEGSYLFAVDYLRELFPGCKFIFVLRDLRGIYSSQKRTMDTERQVRMGFSPLNAAKKYNKVCRIVERHRNEDYFCLVRYEDLLTNREHELDRMLSFLGVRNRKKSRNGYWEKLPDKQKNIHPLIQSEPIEERINAWKTGLSDYEVYLLQKKARRALLDNGYHLMETTKIGMTDRVEIFDFWRGSLENKMYWYGLWVKRFLKMGIRNSSYRE